MKAAGFFGDGNGKNGFAVFADFGALGDKTQAVKVHVRAASQGHHFFISAIFTRRIFFKSGNGQSAGRFKITRVSSLNL